MQVNSKIELVLPQYQLCLVNFNQFFVSTIEPKLIGSIEKYHLYPPYYSTRDRDLFFYHHIILELCNYLLHKKTNDKIIFYVTEDFSESRLCGYYTSQEILDIIKKVIKDIKRCLPIMLYETTTSLNSLNYFVYSQHGRGIEIVNELKALVLKFRKKVYNFEKVKRLTKNYNLTFLNQEFFEDIKTGQILFA